MDVVFGKIDLFWLHSFHYELGGYFFNEIVYLLHFHYTMLEIREGIINHFQHSLDKKESITLASLRTKLSI